MDYIIKASEENNRVNIITTDGIIKFGISKLSYQEMNKVIELLPMMQGCIITKFNYENNHFYLGFKNDNFHKYIEFDYDELLPL